MRSIKEAKVKGKRVLVRVDLDVPMKNGKVMEESRLKATTPTVQYLLKKGATVILLGHMGRPKGKRDPKLSTKQVRSKLSRLIGKPVKHIDRITGVEIEPQNRVFLLENVRFDPGEKKNSAKLAKRIAKQADIYVNDAFATSHRKHASVHAITKYLPSYAGLNLLKEVKELSKLKSPKKPFIVVLGGAKIKTKLGMIEHLASKADTFLIGGGIANTMLKALGAEIGKSLYEKDQIKTANKILKKYGEKIMLPGQVRTDKGTYYYDEIPKSSSVYDIGPKAQKHYASILKNANTIFWNGPMGLFEQKPYDKGSNTIAKAIAVSNAKSIIGGGDTLLAAKKYLDKFSHVSCGGGSTLAFISGENMPALEALK